jgi:hypothetical protein
MSSIYETIIIKTKATTISSIVINSSANSLIEKYKEIEKLINAEQIQKHKESISKEKISFLVDIIKDINKIYYANNHVNKTNKYKANDHRAIISDIKSNPEKVKSTNNILAGLLIFFVDVSMGWLKNENNKESKEAVNLSNTLLKTALNDYVEEGIKNTIQNQKNLLNVNADILKDLYWLNIKKENLDKFSDIISSKLKIEDFSLIYEDEEKTKDKRESATHYNYNRSRFTVREELSELKDNRKNIGYFWMYFLNKVVTKEDDKISYDTFFKLFSFVKDNSSNIIEIKNEKAIEMNYDTFAHLRSRIDESDFNKFKNNADIKTYRSRPFFKSVFFALNDEFTKSEFINEVGGLLVDIKKRNAFLVKENVVLIRKIQESNKVVINKPLDNIQDIYNIDSISDWPKVAQIMKKLGAELTVDDYVNLLVYSKNEDSNKVLLSIATEMAMLNDIEKASESVKPTVKKTVKF